MITPAPTDQFYFVINPLLMTRNIIDQLLDPRVSAIDKSGEVDGEWIPVLDLFCWLHGDFDWKWIRSPVPFIHHPDIERN